MSDSVLRFFREKGIDSVPVKGDSMEPMYKDGDRIQIEKRTPRFGDVVLFMRNNTLFLHRIGFKWGSRFFTIGDNAPVPDISVECNEIVGVAETSGYRLLRGLHAFFRVCYFGLKSRIRRLIP